MWLLAVATIQMVFAIPVSKATISLSQPLHVFKGQFKIQTVNPLIHTKINVVFAWLTISLIKTQENAFPYNFPFRAALSMIYKEIVLSVNPIKSICKTSVFSYLLQIKSTAVFTTHRNLL